MTGDELIEHMAAEWQEKFGPWTGATSVADYAATALAVARPIIRDQELSWLANEMSVLAEEERDFDDAAYRGKSELVDYVRSLLPRETSND